MVREQIATLVEEVEEKRAQSLTATLVPTPTAEYRSTRKLARAATASAGPPAPIPIPIPIPVLSGPRVLIWKQDPSVAEIGIRKAFLPTLATTGPKDARIATSGLPVVAPNALGDFIQTPGTQEFDAVHTYAVVRMTLTMFQRALGAGAPATLPWQWNVGSNAVPITVFPRHSNMMNAFYTRQASPPTGGGMLAFGFFPKPGPAPQPTVFTCRSFDIVAHECGHAILDGLKPNWITSSTPQTGALHEAFGDLTAIFLALSQFDQVEAVIAQTKSNLHDKTFLSDVAEEFGLALGRPNGLRNADNDLKLSQVGTEVHSLSQVFTGAIYDILADIFAFERKLVRDDALTLYDRAAYLTGLLLHGILNAPASNATFTDVGNKMLLQTAADQASGKLTAAQATAYRNFIRNRFAVRQIVLASVPLSELAAALAKPVAADHQMEASQHVSVTQTGGQNRAGCCGTMTSPEFTGVDEAIKKETESFLEEKQKFLEGIKALADETGRKKSTK